MSTERTVHDPKTGEDKTMSEAVAQDPAEIKRLRAEKKAKIMRVLERGQVVDRLQVELPGNLYGEWIPDDKQEIARMQLLDFWVDDKYATQRALHDKGDGRSIMGDTVFMVCERETKEIIDEIRREQFEVRNGKPGAVTKSQGEEKEFASQTKTLGIGPVVEESTTRQVRRDQIAAALNKVNQGTVVTSPGATIVK